MAIAWHARTFERDTAAAPRQPVAARSAVRCGVNWRSGCVCSVQCAMGGILAAAKTKRHLYDAKRYLLRRKFQTAIVLVLLFVIPVKYWHVDVGQQRQR